MILPQDKTKLEGAIDETLQRLNSNLFIEKEGLKDKKKELEGAEQKRIGIEAINGLKS